MPKIELETKNIGIANDLKVVPNSTSYQTTVEFSLLFPQNVQLGVYSLNGELIKNSIPNIAYQKVNYQIIIPTIELPSGIYFLHFQTATARITKKMVVQH